MGRSLIHKTCPSGQLGTLGSLAGGVRRSLHWNTHAHTETTTDPIKDLLVLLLIDQFPLTPIRRLCWTVSPSATRPSAESIRRSPCIDQVHSLNFNLPTNKTFWWKTIRWVHAPGGHWFLRFWWISPRQMVVNRQLWTPGTGNKPPRIPTGPFHPRTAS